MSLILGAHMSISKGFFRAYEETKNDLAANALQIFTKNPRGRDSKPLNPADVESCQAFQRQNHFFAAAHCSYLLNFARSFAADPWPNQSLIDDINRIDAVGGQAVVLHIGKKMDMEATVAYENIMNNIHYVLEKTADKKTMILLENTAGQGSEIGYLFEELGTLIKMIDHPRVHVCIDTCHAFNAGYELRDDSGFDQTLAEFDRHIGLEHIKMFHLNDAKKEKGSRRDRHEDVGHGQIGLPGIMRVVQFAEKNSLPMILETPMEQATYKQQIELIKSNV